MLIPALCPSMIILTNLESPPYIIREAPGEHSAARPVSDWGQELLLFTTTPVSSVT